MLKKKHPEDQLCKAFVQEMDYRIKVDPKLKGLSYYHVANERKCHPATGARLKAMGVREGVADYFIARAVGKYHGLYIECKIKPNKLTQLQEAFLEIMSYEGYATGVAYSAEEAIKIVYDYVEGRI